MFAPAFFGAASMPVAISSSAAAPCLSYFLFSISFSIGVGDASNLVISWLSCAIWLIVCCLADVGQFAPGPFNILSRRAFSDLYANILISLGSSILVVLHSSRALAFASVHLPLTLMYYHNYFWRASSSRTPSRAIFLASSTCP